MDQPIQLVSWRESTTVRLMPEDAEAWHRDPEAFAMRHVSGRVTDMVLRSGSDGFNELTIEYQPLATATCVDCIAEGLAEKASERLEDGTLLCAMHDRHRTTRARGRGLDFGADREYFAGWFRQMAPHSELARKVLDDGLI